MLKRAVINGLTDPLTPALELVKVPWERVRLNGGIRSRSEEKGMLAAYIGFMDTWTDKLRRFINMYHAFKKSERRPPVRSGYYWLFFNFFYGSSMSLLTLAPNHTR